jgi:hypothetical protein
MTPDFSPLLLDRRGGSVKFLELDGADFLNVPFVAGAAVKGT